MKRKLIEELGNIIEGKMPERIDESLEMDAAASLAALNSLLEESETAKTIMALSDTDYRDKDAFFKMVQLLKGLATVVDEDEMAASFMSAVSDALTKAAEKVTDDEDDDDEDDDEDDDDMDEGLTEMKVDHNSAKKGDIFFYRGKPAQIVKTGLPGAMTKDGSVEFVFLKPESGVTKTDLGLDPQFEGPLLRWVTKRPSLSKAMWGEDKNKINEEKRATQCAVRLFMTGGYGDPVKYHFSVKEMGDSGKESLVEKGTGSSAKQAFDKALKVCKDEYGWE